MSDSSNLTVVRSDMQRALAAGEYPAAVFVSGLQQLSGGPSMVDGLAVLKGTASWGDWPR
jgi:hypothetical protein